MAVIEYIREARCLDCKYYVPAPKPFAKSMCGLKEKPTNRKDRVCKDWEYKFIDILPPLKRVGFLDTSV